MRKERQTFRLCSSKRVSIHLVNLFYHFIIGKAQQENLNWTPDNDEENDIMNDLNYRKLELIYNDYELLSGAKGGLDLKTFVKVMTEHFPNRKDPIALVRNLIDLFQ